MSLESVVWSQQPGTKKGLLESGVTFGKYPDFWKVPGLLESRGAFGN